MGNGVVHLKRVAPANVITRLPYSGIIAFVVLKLAGLLATGLAPEHCLAAKVAVTR